MMIIREAPGAEPDSLKQSDAWRIQNLRIVQNRARYYRLVVPDVPVPEAPGVVVLPDAPEELPPVAPDEPVVPPVVPEVPPEAPVPDVPAPDELPPAAPVDPVPPLPVAPEDPVPAAPDEPLPVEVDPDAPEEVPPDDPLLPVVSDFDAPFLAAVDFFFCDCFVAFVALSDPAPVAPVLPLALVPVSLDEPVLPEVLCANTPPAAKVDKKAAKNNFFILSSYVNVEIVVIGPAGNRREFQRKLQREFGDTRHVPEHVRSAGSLKFMALFVSKRDVSTGNIVLLRAVNIVRNFGFSRRKTGHGIPQVIQVFLLGDVEPGSACCIGEHAQFEETASFHALSCAPHGMKSANVPALDADQPVLI